MLATTKDKVINNANAHVNNNHKIRRKAHSSWNKAQVLAYKKNGKIRKVEATKRGAESTLKELKNTAYVSDFTGNQTNCGAGIGIVEVELHEILDLDDPQLWYNTMWEEYQNLNKYGSVNLDNYMYSIDSLRSDFDLDPQKINEIEQLVKMKISEMNGEGAFTQIEKYHKNLTEVVR